MSAARVLVTWGLHGSPHDRGDRARDASGLGRQLLALLEGATVLADHHGDTAADADGRAALVLLRAASDGPS